MVSTTISTKIFLLFCLLFSPGRGVSRKVDISSEQKDITTPITTMPTIIPTTTPTSSSPVLNPTSNPDTASPMIMTPMTMAPATTTSGGLGGSWCVASQSASERAVQVALDYACGHGGADCAAIQPGGMCYNPNTVHAHASYAFNSYFRKNPVPSSCNFGGTAVTTNIDPSSGTCQYQSTSTTSSILNTTNSNGSNVFGAVPYNPSPPSAAAIRLRPPGQPFFTTLTCLVLRQLLGIYYQRSR
ncbi:PLASMODESMATA CALLOSE-BINDING PROTEIN 3 [Gossypium arboreum]|uniref:X8 domain-containing protein n=1 Tax=Gossypium arboreum TaxID=29729 RepID=A0ABR0Q850_GOSAR|nr:PLASMODESMATA CALLOSE-BINDING PROTEIN 3 [Gossypium arboreum]KAK5835073.1 hypothetical protein PVK06_010758 [Gossypium arboreum]